MKNMVLLKFCGLLVCVNFLQCYGHEHMEGKVVRGKYANIQNFPHAVYLSMNCDGSWSCGASILNQRLLLTAAHCVDGCTGRFKIDAIAGTSNVEHVGANVMKQVRRYIMHERYDSQTAFSDIALAFLVSNLPLGRMIQRVIIMPYFPAEVEGLMAGWGDIDDEGLESTYLKQVRQKVRPAVSCGKHMTLLYGMMCATSGTAKDYPASGDSGSALVTQKRQQIGLVSMKARGVGVYMIVYSNVSYFYNWIRHKSKILACEQKKL